MSFLCTFFVPPHLTLSSEKADHLFKKCIFSNRLLFSMLIISNINDICDLKTVPKKHACNTDLLQISLFCESLISSSELIFKKPPNTFMLQTHTCGESVSWALRRVNALSNCNQWEQHDLQKLPVLSSSPGISAHGSQRRQGCWHDGDAGVLVILVVPGRPCWVCAKIKW